MGRLGYVGAWLGQGTGYRREIRVFGKDPFTTACDDSLTTPPTLSAVVLRRSWVAP